jgi:hypothetical protein
MAKELKRVATKKTGTPQASLKPKAVKQKTANPATAARKAAALKAPAVKSVKDGINFGLSMEEMNSKAGQVKYLAAFMDVPQTKARVFMETYNL